MRAEPLRALPRSRWVIDTTLWYNDLLKVTVVVDGLESKQLSSRVHNLTTLALRESGQQDEPSSLQERGLRLQLVKELPTASSAPFQLSSWVKFCDFEVLVDSL